ncbi:hypothetical protein [Enterococcus faecalis]|uniref:hypothetical protein n=1 Tax=Enterococcus TaxID=1350 RepID=UPI001F0D86CB|nr:hypothetical protein [Enterococcus faecalis]MDT2091859.1 hypothetical protein [Enterococcus faecalis]
MLNKRQKNKLFKKWLIANGYSEDGNVRCVKCGKKIDMNDKWQSTYQAYDSTCYGKAINVYP